MNKLVSKFKVAFKHLLQQGLSEPEFFGDLVYKLKRIVISADFSDQFRKIIQRHKRNGYVINAAICMFLLPYHDVILAQNAHWVASSCCSVVDKAQHY